MKKLFKSKVAFIAFVILFTTFLLTINKDLFARIAWSLSMGGLSGFVFAQWYWKDKMDKIKDRLDARMATPEQTELLKRKEEQLKETSNINFKLTELLEDERTKIHNACHSLNEIILRPELYVSTIKAELSKIEELLSSEIQKPEKN